MIVTVTLNPSLDKTLRVTRLNRGELNRAQVVRMDVGGKGFNVSRALLALGMPSLAIGVMAGGTGQALAHGLTALGIEADLIWVEGETRSNITLLEADNGVYTKINEPGPTLSAEAVQEIMHRVEQRARPGDLWVFCGSLPPGAPADLYACLIQRVQGAGALAALDTSGAPLCAAVTALPFLLKPNVPEAEELMGCALPTLADQVAAVRSLQARGIRLVALTRGQEGALLADGAAVLAVKPPLIASGSPVGAGDAFLAGLVYAWSQGADLADMARWAAACGAAAAAQEGTGVGQRAEVEALFAQTCVEKL
ncbi:MAG: 1-phosphofructokinase [Anaerolineae bacterium]|nr:1-phosphofructokinase [Anaerolineae bacterium]MDW8098615.1 1-phosphofructokinase [Anaerolineae bacterium]